MQIDKTNNSAINNLFNLPSKKAGSTQQQTVENESVSADLKVREKACQYVNLLLNTEQVNAERVNKAKKLLESGMLDSEDFISQAAENMLKSGI